MFEENDVERYQKSNNINIKSVCNFHFCSSFNVLLSLSNCLKNASYSICGGSEVGLNSTEQFHCQIKQQRLKVGMNLSSLGCFGNREIHRQLRPLLVRFINCFNVAWHVFFSFSYGSTCLGIIYIQVISNCLI